MAYIFLPTAIVQGLADADLWGSAVMPGTGRTSPPICTRSFPKRMSSPFTIAAMRRRPASPSAEALDGRCAAGLMTWPLSASGPERTVAVGMSIGSGVAANLSAAPQARRADPGDAVRSAEVG